jgi:hypothetical protein
MASTAIVIMGIFPVTLESSVGTNRSADQDFESPVSTLPAYFVSRTGLPL